MGKARQPVVLIVAARVEAAQRIQALFETTASNFGLTWGALSRTPDETTLEEIATVRRVILLGVTLAIGVPAEKLEVWEEANADGRVNQLVARLLGGGGEAPEPTLKPTAKPTPKATPKPIVKVGRETKGRKGKGVTIISEVPLNEAGLRELAATLKQRCGTGGGVEDDRIVIQGDQRERITTLLEEMGYKVKRTGG